MAKRAQLVSRAMSMFNSRTKRNMYAANAPSTTILVLNQLREKPGVSFGNPLYTPGGRAKDFFYSVIIRTFASTSDKNIVGKEEERNGVKHWIKYGQRVSFEILKNKTGGPQYESGEFMYYEKPFDGWPAFSFDNASALFHYGAFNNIIKWNNGVYTFGPVSAKKERDFVIKLRDNYPKTAVKLYQAILEHLRKDGETKTITTHAKDSDEKG